MRSIYQLTLVLSLLAVFSCIAKSAEVEEEDLGHTPSYFIITHPDDAVEYEKSHAKEAWKITVANFGYVQWGRTVFGSVELASPQNACSPLKNIPRKTDHHEIKDSPILVAFQDGCSLQTKARNAQSYGAQMLVVIDSENYEKPEEDKDSEASETRTSTAGLFIPTIMLGREASSKLANLLSYNHTSGERIQQYVTASVQFNIPKADRVKYQIWMTSTDLGSIKFLTSLRQYVLPLQGDAKVEPHYLLWSNVGNDASEIKNNCWSKGKYCAPDPDNDGPLKGTDTLEEALRQLCVYEAGELYWWRYFDNVDANCLKTKRLKECSQTAIEQSGLSFSDIESCADSKFDEPGDRTSNSAYLRAKKLEQFKAGIQEWPSILINNFTYKGDINPAVEVFEAICEGFKTMPPTCAQYILASPISEDNGSEFWYAMFVLFTFIAVSTCFFLIYRKWLQRSLVKEMNQQMNVRISQYFSMQELRDG